MTGYLGPNVDPEDLPHPYEYDDRIPADVLPDSGNPDPWAHLVPEKPMEEEDPVGKCAHPGCPKVFRDRHQWDQNEAQKAGWFFQKNGDRWCPEHNPPWVVEWRLKKAMEKEAREAAERP